MIGFKNEFFEVIESAGKNTKNRSLLWKCKCKCGEFDSPTCKCDQRSKIGDYDSLITSLTLTRNASRPQSQP